jgi:hypothetical protein
MFEYAFLLGKDVISLFSFDSVKGWILIFLSAIAFLIVGYVLKGVWGAIIALLFGTALFLYLKGVLPV